MDEAIAKLEAEGAPEIGPAIVIAGEGWPPGVVGIVAAKLVDKYQRPAFVIGVDPVTGLGRGSARTAAGVDLYEALTAAARGVPRCTDSALRRSRGGRRIHGAGANVAALREALRRSRGRPHARGGLGADRRARARSMPRSGSATSTSGSRRSSRASGRSVRPIRHRCSSRAVRG